MTKLILALAKSETDALSYLLQQRGLVAAILPTDVEDFVRDFLCFLACLHWIEKYIATFSPAEERFFFDYFL